MGRRRGSKARRRMKGMNHIVLTGQQVIIMVAKTGALNIRERHKTHPWINSTHTTCFQLIKLNYSKVAKFEHSDPRTLSFGWRAKTRDSAMEVIRPLITILFEVLVVAMYNWVAKIDPGSRCWQLKYLPWYLTHKLTTFEPHAYMGSNNSAFWSA